MKPENRIDKQAYPKLPESELAVMQAVWTKWRTGEQEHISAGTLMESDPELARLKLTTVLTLLTRLMDKGFLEVKKEGRTNCYRPTVSEQDYKRQATASFLATVCQNDSRQLFSALWSGGMLSREDIAELQAMISRTEEKQEKGE